MAINRRRAPSSRISSEKKLEGHANEKSYAALIDAETIQGTQKSDVIDKYGNRHSVKSGKKWQVFLYGHERISKSLYLNALLPCLDAFTEDSELYFGDRIKCIEFKEAYVHKYGKDRARLLDNSVVKNFLGQNTYVQSKENLSQSTEKVYETLKNKDRLRNFLGEALFNVEEVKFLAIKGRDSTRFEIFERENVLDVLTKTTYPSLSQAGREPRDYNVPKQKTLLCYKKENNVGKNIVEIEIRNDSPTHYRQVRFNMYSKDTLEILRKAAEMKLVNKISDNLWAYGAAAEIYKE